MNSVTRSIKRIIISAIIVFICIGICPLLGESTIVLASTDTEGPIINSLSVDKSNVTVGDTITFTLIANDESGLSQDSSTLTIKNSSDNYKDIRLSKIDDTTLSGTLAITDNFVNGEYTVLVINVWDSNQNLTQQLGYPGITITVSGAISDNKGPEMESFSADKTETKIGETVTFTIKVSDESGVLDDPNRNFISFKDSNNNYKYLRFTKTDDNTLSGILRITDDYLYDEYTILEFYIVDIYGNQTNLLGYNGYKLYVSEDGHNWDEEYTVDKEPTKTEEGSESIHCSICDAVKEGSSRSIPALNVIEHGTCGDNLTWVLDDEGTLTINGTGEMGNYIEDSLAPWYSYRTQITHIVIENGVLSVGDYAFYNLYKALDVSFPTSVNRVGQYAFCNCNKIETIEFSETWVSIEQYAFKDCKNLTSAIIPFIVCNLNQYGNIDSNNSNQFAGCTSLTDITIGGENLPQLFDLSDAPSISHVTLLDTVKTINNSFYNCEELASIDLPVGLEKIGDNAFARTSIKTVIIPKTVTTIGGGAFASCEQLRTVTFNEGLLKIGERAFSSSSIESIQLPDSVVDLGSNVFMNCDSLIQVKLGNGIKELKGGEAHAQYVLGMFYGCTELENVDLGSVESIGALAFAGCKKLRTIRFPSTLKTIYCGNGYPYYESNTYYFDNNGSFAGSGLETIYIDDYNTWINTGNPMPQMANGINVYVNNELLEQIVIPDSVTTINYEQFARINNIKTVVIPDSVTAIDGCAFLDSKSLYTITIPESVSRIGSGAFDGCEKLTNVIFEGNSMSFEQAVFVRCSSLSEISLPSRSSTSGLLFQDCTNLQTVSLGNSMVKFDVSDFLGCSKLEEVIVPRGVKEITRIWDYTSEQIQVVFIVEEGSNHLDFVRTNGYRYDLTSGHVLNEGEIIKHPTCTEEGEKNSLCETCNRQIAVIIPALGHNWNTGYTVDKEATCIEEGYKSIHCASCGAVDESSIIVLPKNDHEYGDWSVSKDATCTEDGSKEKICAVCGDKVTETIKATGHTFEDEFTVDVEPTCTTEGSKSKHCKKCDEVTEVTPIDALGHSFGSWVEVTPSSCEGEGVRQHTCDVCGFAESASIDPKGHEWEDDYTVDVPATCTTDGSESIHCKNCEVTKDSRVITALGHSYGDWTTTKEPTCTEKGSIERVCSACGDKVTEEVIALGHSWNSEPTVDKAASCTEDGSQSIHCSRCNAIDEATVQSISAIGHSYGDPSYTWADDYSTVTASMTCKNDSSHVVSETAKTTSEVTKPATYTTKGETTYTAAFNNKSFYAQTKTVSNINKLSKAANTLTVTPKTATIKASKIKKKKQTLACSKILTVGNPQGTVSYKLVGVTKAKFKKYFTINASTGKVTVKKGLKKGTYKVKVTVSATGNTQYNAATKTVTFKIKVK